MSAIDNTLVPVPYGVLKKLESDLATAKLEIDELKGRAPAAVSDLLTDLSASERRFRSALDLALDALGIYTTRVSPYDTKGLPAAFLRRLAKVLLQLVDHSYAETADTLLELCGEIDSCEAKRTANPKPVHVATGEEWRIGREAFEREFGVDPSEYRNGGMAGVIKARAAKDAAAAAALAVNDSAHTQHDDEALAHLMAPASASQPSVEDPTTTSQPIERECPSCHEVFDDTDEHQCPRTKTPICGSCVGACTCQRCIENP